MYKILTDIQIAIGKEIDRCAINGETNNALEDAYANIINLKCIINE